MKLRIIITLFITLTSFGGFAQDQTLLIENDMFDEYSFLKLADLDGWIYNNGHDPSWAGPDLETTGWQNLKPSELSSSMEDENGVVEGWFRIKIKVDESLNNEKFYLYREMWAATDVYLDGQPVTSFGNTGTDGNPYNSFNPFSELPAPIELTAGKEYLLAIHFVNQNHPLMLREYQLEPERMVELINLTGLEFYKWKSNALKWSIISGVVGISTTALLMLFFWGLFAQNRNEKIFLLIALLSTLVFLHAFIAGADRIYDAGFNLKILFGFITSFLAGYIVSIDLKIVEKIVDKRVPYLSTAILILFPPVSFIAHTYNQSIPFSIVNTVFLLYFSYLVIRTRKTITKAQLAVIIGTIANVLTIMIVIGLMKFYSTFSAQGIINILILIYFLSIPVSLLVYVALRFNETLKEVKAKALELVNMSEEKKQILADQNVFLEQQVQERTQELNDSLENLKSTQTQLIHSEKMASLGELTAGIAHEIQNPLNFVNNFSDLSNELLEELEEEVESGNTKEVKEITKDLKDNLSKIHSHGERASSIVKGMLQHSRTGSGEKELTDLNAMADEYLRLAYHGLRAKDKSFNANFELNIDENLPKIKVVPQDIGRVLLNLINNAFHAVKDVDNPTVEVSTKSNNETIEIIVQDNGKGIPKEIKDKIFQPFFTTKATGEGTGLGLSMSYDIITKGHGGKLTMVSQDRGVEFIINLPV